MAASKAHTSDGLLDIVILKNSGSFKMLDEFVKMRGEDDNSNNDSNEYTDDGNILYTKVRGVVATYILAQIFHGRPYLSAKF